MGRLVRILGLLVACLVIVERFLFLQDVYSRLLTERKDDFSFVNHVCEVVGHQFTGRHASLCEQASRRLDTPAFISAVRMALDQTLYVDLSLVAVLKFSCVFICFVLMDRIDISRSEKRNSRSEETVMFNRSQMLPLSYIKQKES